MSQSAPYLAFLSEIGILPVEKQIPMEKIILYYTIPSKRLTTTE